MSIVAVLDVPLRADTSNLDAGLSHAESSVKGAAAGINGDLANLGAKMGSPNRAALDGMSAQERALLGTKEKLWAQEGKLAQQLADQRRKIADKLAADLGKAAQAAHKAEQDRHDRAMAAIGTSFAAAFGGVGGFIGSLVANFGALGGPAALAVAAIGTVSAAVKGLADMVREGIGSMTELGRAAARLGATTSELAGFQHAAGLLGIAADEMTEKLAKFQRNLSKAAQGEGEAIAGLGELGLVAQQLTDVPLAESLGQIGDALKGLKAGDQIRLADQLIGKGADRLLPFLTQGAEGIRRMIDEARSLGPTSSAAVAQVKAVSDGWLSFKATLAGMARSLAVIFAPALTAVTGWFADLGKAIAQWLGDPENIAFIKLIASELWEVGKVIFEVTNPAFTALAELFGQVTGSGPSWQSIREIALQVIFGIEYAIQHMGEVWAAAMNSLALLAAKAVNKVSGFFNEILPDDLKLPTIDTGPLEARLIDSAKGMTDYIDKKLAEFKDKARAITKEEAKAPGAPSGPTDKKQSAYEFGSKEAFSTLLGSEDYTKKAYAVANQQLAENKKMTRLLEKLLGNLYGVKLAKARL